MISHGGWNGRLKIKRDLAGDLLDVFLPMWTTKAGGCRLSAYGQLCMLPSKFLLINWKNHTRVFVARPKEHNGGLEDITCLNSAQFDA